MAWWEKYEPGCWMIGDVGKWRLDGVAWGLAAKRQTEDLGQKTTERKNGEEGTPWRKDVDDVEGLCLVGLLMQMGMDTYRWSVFMGLLVQNNHTHTHTHTHTQGDTGEFLWEGTLFWFNRNKNEAVMDINIICWIATQPQVVPNQYDWLTDFHRTQKKKLKKSSGTTLWGLKFPLGFSEIKSYRFETTLGQNNILKMFQPFCTYN